MRPSPICLWMVTRRSCRIYHDSHGAWRSITRPYSTAAEARAESHRVACGSSGYVTVDIYNSHALASTTTPMIVHLPPTGTHLRSKHLPVPAFLLSDAFRAYPLASINYRWNHVPDSAKADLNEDELSPFYAPAPLPSSPDYNNYPFPTPLHDTLHGYTWLTETFLPSLSGRKVLRYPPPPPSPYAPAPISAKTTPRPLIIYGSRLGGTLATSLGLTESRVSRLTNQIAGVIVRDGIFDWTGFATSLPKNLPKIDMSSPTNLRDSEIWSYINNETPPSPPPSPNSESYKSDARLPTTPASNLALESFSASPNLPTTAAIHQIKSHLFAQPSSCFDNFASPILFFRTPGFSIPRFFPGTKPSASPPSANLAGLSISEAERADLEAMLGAEEEAASSKEDVKGQGKEEEIEILRKSMLKFPQANSGLKIPRVLFLVSANRPGEKDQELVRQAEEMGQHMRRSVLMHELKDRAAWDDDLDPESAIQDRVQMHQLTSTVEGEVADVVGGWMEDFD